MEINPDSSNIYFYILVVSRFYYMVHYMTSYLGICLKLSGTQGPTGSSISAYQESTSVLHCIGKVNTNDVPRC